MSNNAAAMREALLKAIILLKVCEWPDDTPMQEVAEVIDEIEKASSAPPRNCDVGTPEEQANRFAIHCDKHPKCRGCQCCGVIPFNRCEFVWAQMPYEEGGAR